ncbi:AraC family ligand binding domain-containing protein [Terribacillus saccharophilus]|uniref:AraC family transcriptional regulator n=1 Tax=Terribacillus saccharophilus TaxID=361277 RepID=UPI003981B516
MEKFIYKKSAGITALSASMKEFTYKKHAHREYAMGVTLRGIQQYNLDGHKQLSYPNGVMLFNPEQTHDGMAHDETGLEYVMLYLEPELLQEITGQKELIRFADPILYDAGLEHKILKLAQAILNEKEEVLCNELAVTLTDRLTKTELDKSSKKDNKLILKAKEMMHSNLQDVLKLDEISFELNLSKYKFIRLFKAYTGISPYQYFLNSKVEHAKQIIGKEKDIYEAVAACGFVDLAHLNRHFKSIYGTTAYEYMTNMR